MKLGEISGEACGRQPTYRSCSKFCSDPRFLIPPSMRVQISSDRKVKHRKQNIRIACTSVRTSTNLNQNNQRILHTSPKSPKGYLYAQNDRSGVEGRPRSSRIGLRNQFVRLDFLIGSFLKGTRPVCMMVFVCGVEREPHRVRSVCGAAFRGTRMILSICSPAVCYSGWNDIVNGG